MTQPAAMTFHRTGGYPVRLRLRRAAVYDRRPGTRSTSIRAPCRQRAYRKRARERLRDAGLPERLNLQVAEGTAARHGDAQTTARKRTRRSPDLRISYRKAVEAVAAELERFSTGSVSHRRRAERALAPLLSDRQRAALKEQR
jgi:hypothetical protein